MKRIDPILRDGHKRLLIRAVRQEDEIGFWENGT